jgi:hypothetical protein
MLSFALLANSYANMQAQMLLSITSEQNTRPEFAGDVPTDAEVAKLERVVPEMDLEETLEYAKTLIPDEVASSLFNRPLKLHRRGRPCDARCRRYTRRAVGHPRRARRA